MIFNPYILQIIPSLESKNGGPSEGAKNIHLELIKRNFQVDLLTFKLDKFESAKSKDSSIILVEGLLLKRYFLSLRLLMSAPINSIFYIHGLHRPLSWLSGIIARIRKIPYVVQLHGTLEPYEFRRHPFRKKMFLILVGNLFLKGARYLIAASPQESDNIGCRFPNLPTLTIPLGVDLHEFEESQPKDLKAGFFETDESNRILFLGRLAKKKNPNIAVALCELNPNIHIVIAGSDGFWSKESLLNLIDRKLHDRVSIIGQVNSSERRWLMNRSSIFILPSENENFGISVAEAACHGMLCLVSNQTATSSYIELLSNGTVCDTLNPSDWSRELFELLNRYSDKAARDSISLRAQDLFSWQKYVGILLESLNITQYRNSRN